MYQVLNTGNQYFNTIYKMTISIWKYLFIAMHATLTFIKPFFPITLMHVVFYSADFCYFHYPLICAVITGSSASFNHHVMRTWLLTLARAHRVLLKTDYWFSCTLQKMLKHRNKWNLYAFSITLRQHKKNRNDI